MTIPKDLIVIDRRSKTPVYVQIAKAIVHGIRSGRLMKGGRLPGTAALAAVLGINRKTLQAAYDEIMAQGWIEIVARKGAFVAPELPEMTPNALPGDGGKRRYPKFTGFALGDVPPARFPEAKFLKSDNLVLDGGLPDVRLAPIAELIREYRNLTKRKDLQAYLKYGDPAGSRHLTETLTAFLRETRGLAVTEKNLIVTRGAQMAFYVTARLLLRPGDHVAVGAPGYAPIEVLYRRLGAIVDRIPVDQSGIDLDYLVSLCRTAAPRLVYVMPHHHYPTNATLVPERRVRLLELAARHEFAIIEDDFDYDFEYESGPFLPIASLDDRGSVVYVGTLSKTVFPSMRIGFLLAPANLIEAALQLRRSVDGQGDSMMEAAVAALYRNGSMKAHIRKAVKTYRARRDHMARLLREAMGDRIFFEVPSGGMGFWARFAGVDLGRAAAVAFEKGLTMSERLIFNPGTDRSDWARLGFASLGENEQERAVAILNDSILASERIRARGGHRP